MTDAPPFGFVQFEFGFQLGPPDGRYLVRDQSEGPPVAVLVLGTLGATERRRMRGRRAKTVEQSGPAPVPTSRATVVRPQPFDDRAAADEWLAYLRGSDDAVAEELGESLAVVNRALCAHRLAAADPAARDVTDDAALAIRVGFGSGETVAEGRYAQAWALPVRDGRRTRRSMDTPDERFAALLGAREQPLVCEELVLRVRADLDAGRGRAAALGARVALESLLAEIGTEAARLAPSRGPVGEAANAALRGELAAPEARAVEQALEGMEAALRARRLRAGR